jgi:hypothetical protein
MPRRLAKGWMLSGRRPWKISKIAFKQWEPSWLKKGDTYDSGFLFMKDEAREHY